MSLIELQNVSKLYGFGNATTVALDEINLKVDKGEFVAVMGPSGSGKSTLMNIIGLLDRPTHGTYQLSGRSTARLRANRQAKLRRDNIGFVFQQFSLLPSLTVLENVALPLVYKGIRPIKRLKQASALLEQVGLKDREYFVPRQLSGGQIQRVAIARALINNPGIIIADEPTGNLDSGASRLVMELFNELHQSGNTILMVTHNPELTRYASRVVYMHDGAIVYDQETPIGQVPRIARRIITMFPRKTEDDDLAGVSALMKAVPGKALTKKRAKSHKPRTKKALPSKRTKNVRR